MRIGSLGFDQPAFWRRRCPRCQRAFQLHPQREQASELARELLRRLPHANTHEFATSKGLAQPRCPYCGASAALWEFLPKSVEAALDRQAAWLGAWIRCERLRLPERTLGQNPFVSFLPVPPKDPLGPVRWAERLEPVPLVCCGGELSLEVGWAGTLCCPYCPGGRL